jgi:hypothetical protein
LDESNDQEVDVHESTKDINNSKKNAGRERGLHKPELLHEILGEERKDGIFCVLNCIPGIAL